MGINGFFRQHFSNNGGYLSEVFNFGERNEYLRFSNNLFGLSSSHNELTFNVWIYPETTNAQYIFDTDGLASLHIQAGKIRLNINDTGVVHSVQTINQNQWNQILISMRRNNDAVVSHGSNSGSTFSMTTKRSYNTGTSYLNDFHMVVNGTRYSRYVQPNTSPSQQDGFFHNDFATGTTGTSASNGEYFDSQYGTTNQLFTSDNTTDTYVGTDYNGLNGFQGDMFQWYLKDEYYDLLDSNNIDLFRDGSSHQDPLPSNPVCHIVGGEGTFVGSNTSTVFNYNIDGAGDGVRPSTRSKP